MIYLIEYDRAGGVLINLYTYEDKESDRASSERLALEISLMKSCVAREVVLLQAASIDALKVTHNRYFQNVEQLAETGSNLVRRLKLDDHQRSSKNDS
jgi:hypothetical protein